MKQFPELARRDDAKGFGRAELQQLRISSDEDPCLALLRFAEHQSIRGLDSRACCFLDYSTNLAETASIVAPDWQGCGLGAALQRRPAEHARAPGVRGFVAEILPSNEYMIRLAQAASAQGTVEPSGETPRVTAPF